MLLSGAARENLTFGTSMLAAHQGFASLLSTRGQIIYWCVKYCCVYHFLAFFSSNTWCMALIPSKNGKKQKGRRWSQCTAHDLWLCQPSNQEFFKIKNYFYSKILQKINWFCHFKITEKHICVLTYVGTGNHWTTVHARKVLPHCSWTPEGQSHKIYQNQGTLF